MIKMKFAKLNNKMRKPILTIALAWGSVVVNALRY